MKYAGGLLRHDRASRVVNALNEWNAHLRSDDLHNKYNRMAISAFVFYRGTAHLFWADFANDWRLNRFGSSKTRTWLQGDAHAENMGAYADHKGRLIYGLNDFDESLIGDYQYDLWRFAVSLVLVARRNGGFSGKAKARVIDAFCDAYLDTAAAFTDKSEAPETILTLDNSSGALLDFLQEVHEGESRKKMLKKWTRKVDGERRFDLGLEKLDQASEWEDADIREAMPAYRESLEKRRKGRFFAIQDIARRLSAGTGSLGTPRYYLLIRGDGDSWKDDRILDVKRQSRPSALRHLSAEEQVDYVRDYEHDAHRHAVAYKALAKGPDKLLGWMRLHDGYYSVRERSPFKETFETENLTRERTFIEWASIWARVLATDHICAAAGLKTGGKIAKEVTRLTSKRRPEFRARVRDVAFEYATQAETDYGYFMDAMQPNHHADD
ncbi:MAG: DUF2252 family protein [Acidobacteriota bacterium]